MNGGGSELITELPVCPAGSAEEMQRSRQAVEKKDVLKSEFDVETDQGSFVAFGNGKDGE